MIRYAFVAAIAVSIFLVGNAQAPITMGNGIRLQTDTMTMTMGSNLTFKTSVSVQQSRVVFDGIGFGASGDPVSVTLLAANPTVFSGQMFRFTATAPPGSNVVFNFTSLRYVYQWIVDTEIQSPLQLSPVQGSIQLTWDDWTVGHEFVFAIITTLNIVEQGTQLVLIFAFVALLTLLLVAVYKIRQWRE